MKKVFLTVALIMATSSVMNANSTVKQVTEDGKVMFNDCAETAWNYGTHMAAGNEELAYYYTDRYYERHC